MKAQATRPQNLKRQGGNNGRQQLRVSTAPRVTMNRNCSLVNRELLTTMVMGKQITHKGDYLVNPRNLGWGKHIAYAYDMYRPRRITFTYVPRVPTTTRGRICLFLDYDPTDDNSAMGFTDIAAMGGAVVDSLYKSVSVSYNPRSTVIATHGYFCNDSDTPDRLAHCCRLWVLVEGGDSATEEICGEVFIDYDFEMYNPEMPPSMMPQTLRIHAPSGTAGNASNPLGTFADITATAASQAASLKQVQNLLRDAQMTLMGGVFEDSMALATKADMNLAVDGIMTSYSDTDTVVASATYSTLWPSTQFIVFKTNAECLLVVAQFQYYYTSTSASDIPSYQYTLNSDSWGCVGSENMNPYKLGVPASKIGVATQLSQIVVLHLRRKRPNRGLVIQFVLTGPSSGAIAQSRANDVMVSPYPTDFATPYYG